MKALFGWIVVGLLLGLNCVSWAQNAQCTLLWDAVTQYEDDTPLQVTGYRLYERSEGVSHVKGQFAYEIPYDQFADPLAPQVSIVCKVDHYYRVTAYVTSESTTRESAFSNEIKTIRVTPRPIRLRGGITGPVQN